MAMYIRVSLISQSPHNTAAWLNMRCWCHRHHHVRSAAAMSHMDVHDMDEAKPRFAKVRCVMWPMHTFA